MDIGNFDVKVKEYLKFELNNNRLKWRYHNFDKMRITFTTELRGELKYTLPGELDEQLDATRKSYILKLWNERHS